MNDVVHTSGLELKMKDGDIGSMKTLSWNMEYRMRTADRDARVFHFIKDCFGQVSVVFLVFKIGTEVVMSRLGLALKGVPHH